MKRSRSPARQAQASIDEPTATRRKLQMDLDVVPNTLSDGEHGRMDLEVFGTITGLFKRCLENCATDDPDFLSAAAFLLATIVSTSKPFLDPKYGENQNAKALLKEHPNLAEKLRVAWKDGGFKEIRSLKILRIPEEVDHGDRTKQEETREVDEEASAAATELSWSQPYIGDASEALWNHIAYHTHQSQRTTSGSTVYAHYISIIQSSGMGKSRTVDEMAKKHFVIPINLRGPGSKGFPAPDTAVYSFLAQHGSQEEAFLRAHVFLTSLLIETKSVVRELFDQGTTSEALPDDFRRLLTEGQKMSSHNEARRKFYENIVRRAKEMMAHGESAILTGKDAIKSPIPKINLRHGQHSVSVGESADELLKAILAGGGSRSPSPSPMPRGSRASSRLHKKRNAPPKESTKIGTPLVVLAFDEAHVLTDKQAAGDGETWSAFSELRRALRALNHYRLFSLFLSTTGKINQFTSAAGEDLSNRVQEGHLILIEPFTDLGFDQIARKIAGDGTWTLDDVAADAYMVCLGRPMIGTRYYSTDNDEVRLRIVGFATEKLLNGPLPRELTPAQKLACLSQRLPIEFHSTTYSARQQEKKQVEGHLRVCLKVLPGFEGMITTSPSEPILSEAAYHVMSRLDMDAPKALQEVMSGFSVNRGDRGEFVVMLLLTLARDRAVAKNTSAEGLTGSPRVIRVLDFLDRLFHKNIASELPSDVHPNCSSPGIALGDAFANAQIHFNHFIKVHQHCIVNRKYLLWLMFRGAAVLCGNNQAGIDGVIPFVYRDNRLRADNIGVILWQSKNDDSFGSKPIPKLFHAMDPFALGIFDPTDTNEPPIPVIRIVFALAAKNPSFSFFRPKEMAGSCTAYDIWSAGLSSSIHAPILPKAESVWHSLLLASHGWEDAYKTQDKQAMALRMTMNPGAAADRSFWTRWTPE